MTPADRDAEKAAAAEAAVREVRDGMLVGLGSGAAAAHAVRALSEGLRMEVKPYNIRTTVISPGAVDTDLPNSVTEPDIAEIVRHAHARALPAATFARAVAYAMSEPDDVDINEIVFRSTREAF